MRLLFCTMFYLSFSVSVMAQDINLEESDLIIQSAQDILRHIDDEAGELPDADVLSPVPAPVPSASPEPEIQKTTILKRDETYDAVLNFLPFETVLSEDHQYLLLDKVLSRLLDHPDARLEINAHADSVDGQESAVRRLSLMRGLAISDFLRAKGVSERRIYVRALGNAGQPNNQSVELSISRL